MMVRAKRICILIIKVNKLFSFTSLGCFIKEIENMFTVFLSSYRNMLESLGELKKKLVLPNFHSHGKCFLFHSNHDVLIINKNETFISTMYSCTWIEMLTIKGWTYMQLFWGAVKDYTGWDFRIWPLAVNGLAASKRFSLKENVWVFHSDKETWPSSNNEVTVLQVRCLKW